MSRLVLRIDRFLRLLPCRGLPFDFLSIKLIDIIWRFRCSKLSDRSSPSAGPRACGLRRSRSAARARRNGAAQCLVRSDPRALSRDRRGLRREVEEGHRRDDHDPAVAWRIGRAGPRGDRRSQGGRRDAGARRRHRRDRRQDRQDPGRLAEAPAEQFRRPIRPRSSSSSARATRRGSTTGTISPSPASPSSPRTRRRRAGARWNFLAAWGYGLKAFQRRRGQDARFRRRDLQERRPCSTPARAARP